MTSQFSRAREQTQVGKNLCDRSRLQRARQGAARSPWSKFPSVNTAKARETFERNKRITKRTIR